MQSFLETAAAAAREAGALINEFAAKRIGFELKGEYDLVTAADRAAEKLIVERLTSAFPTHSIVAEEGGGQQVSSEYCWYVDPLDGTTNFAHGFPVYNVSIGLEKAGELVAGVVYDPTRNELFSAERGSGAFLNGERIESRKPNGWTTRLWPPDFLADGAIRTLTSIFTISWRCLRMAFDEPEPPRSTSATWHVVAWMGFGNSA